MIGPVLVEFGLLILALRGVAARRWPAWRGHPCQLAGAAGLALFIGGLMLGLRAPT